MRLEQSDFLRSLEAVVRQSTLQQKLKLAVRWNRADMLEEQLGALPLWMPDRNSLLRKALQMPRVGLFIADDVSLGKTIEAGLILREMLLRQRIRRVVISCPLQYCVSGKKRWRAALAWPSP